jgi:YgiT-type zinc finger domain-containing protein
MTCLQCRGAMKRGASPFHVDRKGYHLLFDAVPSWVCSQCGEVLLEEAEVDAIQQAIKSVDRSTERFAAAA